LRVGDWLLTTNTSSCWEKSRETHQRPNMNYVIHNSHRSERQEVGGPDLIRCDNAEITRPAGKRLAPAPPDSGVKPSPSQRAPPPPDPSILPDRLRPSHASRRSAVVALSLLVLSDTPVTSLWFPSVALHPTVHPRSSRLLLFIDFTALWNWPPLANSKISLISSSSSFPSTRAVLHHVEVWELITEPPTCCALGQDFLLSVGLSASGSRLPLLYLLSPPSVVLFFCSLSANFCVLSWIQSPVFG